METVELKELDGTETCWLGSSDRLSVTLEVSVRDSSIGPNFEEIAMSERDSRGG